MLRRHRVVAPAGCRAGQPVGQPALPPLVSLEIRSLVQCHDGSLAPLQACLNRVSQAPARLVADDQPVDHDLDGVFLFSIKRHPRVCLQLRQLAVDPCPNEALTRQFFQHVTKLALLIFHHRREQHHPCILRQTKQLLDDVTCRKARDRLTTLRAMCLADIGEQQPQVVVNLGRRGDGRTRVATGGTLLDRDRRREALDVVDVRLLQLIQKLPCI